MKAIKVGDTAPDFEVQDQDGKAVRLSDFKGKKLVMFFYSGDDTETCTNECLSFRERFKEFQKRGYEVLAVSPDSVKNHKKFQTKYKFPFTLISDPDLRIMKPYGAWGEKLFFGKVVDGLLRIVIVMDEAGKITHIIPKFLSKKAAQIVLQELKN